MMNKRAVSPLVSTLILIVAAIGIGIIIMNWGRAALEETSKCAVDTEMQIVKLNQNPQICQSGSGINGIIHFILENGPNTEINRIHFRVIGEKGVFTQELDKSSIDVGSSIIKDIPYNYEQFGNILQIKLTPMLILYPEEPLLLCSEQAIVIEDIPQCI